MMDLIPARLEWDESFPDVDPIYAHRNNLPGRTEDQNNEWRVGRALSETRLREEDFMTLARG